jgi:transposase-like protein
MPVLDQLRVIEQQVEKRLRELAPLVAEYRDLEKVAERLGLKRDAPELTDAPAAKPAARARRKPKPSRSRARTTQASKSRASQRKPTAAAPASARSGATTEAATAKPTRAAASKRATPKAKSKPKPTAATRGTSTEGTTTTRSRRKAAAPGQRQQDVVRLVSERPGITVAELAQELGVDATGLYGVVRRLQAKGQISKEGTALRPVDESRAVPQARSVASPEPTTVQSSPTTGSPAPASEPPAT